MLIALRMYQNLPQCTQEVVLDHFTDGSFWTSLHSSSIQSLCIYEIALRGLGVAWILP